MTLPVGRFLIDLPRDACAHFGRQGFNEAGPFIQTLPLQGPGEARAMVEAQAEAMRVPHEEGGTQLESLVEGRIANSWFIYFWRDTAFKDETLDLIGYFWLDGLLFVFKNTCLPDPVEMAERARVLEATFRLMRRRSLLEIPAEPGFCLREAFFPGRAARFSDEHIELLVNFPAKPGMSLRFCTDTVGEVIANYTRLLERDERCCSVRKHPGNVRLRARERAVGPFPGQELVKRVSRPGGGLCWSFTWEYLGQPRDPLAPMMLLEMRAGGKGETLDQHDFFSWEVLGLWDGVLDSLRRRDFFLRYLRLPDTFRSS